MRSFIVIIYGIIQEYGISGLTVATLMAGVLLILLGVFKLGAAVSYTHLDVYKRQNGHFTTK